LRTADVAATPSAAARAAGGLKARRREPAADPIAGPSGHRHHDTDRDEQRGHPRVEPELHAVVQLDADAGAAARPTTVDARRFISQRSTV